MSFTFSQTSERHRGGVEETRKPSRAKQTQLEKERLLWLQQHYYAAQPKTRQRMVLTQEQRQKGQTWIYPSQPERPYVIGQKPGEGTSVLQPPETYETWLPIAGPERPYIVGKHEPRVTDVTLIKAPPSVRAELRQREYEERQKAYQTKIQASRAFWGDIQLRLFGVQTKLATTETGLRELSLIQQQRTLGYEFIGKEKGELFFAPPKGIAQRIYEFKLPGQEKWEAYQSILGRVGFEEKAAPPKKLGVFVAPFESTFYGVGGLVGGVKKTFETGHPQLAYGWEWAGLKTPIIPATASGAIFSSEEREKFKALTHEEKMAGLIGEISLAWLTGKAATKITHVIAKPIQVKAQSWLSTKYLEKGKFAWKGWKEKLVMRLTGAKPYTARGEISLPHLTGKLSFQKLKVSQAAWEMTQSPRMGGVWLRNLGVAPTQTKVLPHLISRGGAISIGYLRELSFEEPMWKRGLLPFVTQTQVTRSGILPYIPKLIATTGKHGISYWAIGFGITTLAKVRPSVPRVETVHVLKPLPSLTTQPKHRERQFLLPKLWFPTLAYQREKFRSLTIETPKRKQKNRSIPILTLSPLTGLTPERKLKLPPIQITPPIITTTTTQIAPPVTIQPPTLVPPSLPPFTPPTPPTIPPFRPPYGGQDVSRGQRGLFGAWFKRTHKIKTPAQIMQSFTGSQRKTKKRKKKKMRGVKLFGF